MADDLNAPYEYPFPQPSEDSVRFGDGAIPGRPAGSPASYAEGGSTRWTPEAISEVHALAQLGRYQVRGFNTFNKRLPTFDDLTFVPASMTRLPLEGYRESCDTTTVLGGGRGLVEKPIVLKIPIYIASMSFGALSANAKAGLGYGASESRHDDLHRRRRHAGGGARGFQNPAVSDVAGALPHRTRPFAPRRRAGNRDRPRRQARHRRPAARHEGERARLQDAHFARGRRPTLDRAPSPISSAPTISQSRSRNCASPPIIRRRSSSRWARQGHATTWRSRAKAGADVVVVDGAEGGTGASPELLLNHTGVPTMSAIRAAREALDECGMSGKVSLVAAGGLRSGVDAAKCLALGADAVMIGNAAMMALGCNSPRYLADYERLGTSPGACHHCHTGLCPVGVATQDAELEKRMDPHAGAERVARYLTAMTMEITCLAKACGKSSVHNLETEDLRALSFEASAFTGVKMAGIDKAFSW